MARSDARPTSLDLFTDEEQMLRESGVYSSLGAKQSKFDPIVTVARFAQEIIAPKVREMDEAEMMDPEVIKGLFEQGVSAYPSQTRRYLTSPLCS